MYTLLVTREVCNPLCLVYLYVSEKKNAVTELELFQISCDVLVIYRQY